MEYCLRMYVKFRKLVEFNLYCREMQSHKLRLHSHGIWIYLTGAFTDFSFLFGNAPKTTTYVRV